MAHNRFAYISSFRSLSAVRKLLIIIGAIIFIDCFVLIALTKINFGTVVPFLLSIVFLVHGFYWKKVQAVITAHKLLQRMWKTLWVLFFVWLVSFVVFTINLQYKINTQPPLTQAKAVIMLGAGVNGDRPTPSLASRLDGGAKIIKQYPNILPIVTGGVGFNRSKSEAFVMANYLKNTHGINYNRIQQEGKSTSTEENLLFSRPILKANAVSLHDNIAIVTNDFHTVRAKAIAQRMGFTNVTTVATPTPWSIKANAWFREYFAFVSGWVLGEY